MRRLRWLVARAALLYRLAEGPLELVSVTLFILRFLLSRHINPRRGDFTVKVQGIRFLLGPDEATSLGEVFAERCYEQLPDFVPKEGWVVVDVGANVGAFALLQACRGAHVVAFEPNPECYRRLLAATHANSFGDHLTIVQRAVAEAPGHAQLAVADGNTLLGSLFLTPAGGTYEVIRVSWIDGDGPLVPFARGYRQELVRLGHPPGTVKTQMVLAGQLNRWLCAEGLSVSHLTPSVAETFLATRRASDQRRVPTLASLALLFEYLKCQDALPPEQPKTLPGQRRDAGSLWPSPCP